MLLLRKFPEIFEVIKANRYIEQFLELYEFHINDILSAGAKLANQKIENTHGIVSNAIDLWAASAKGLAKLIRNNQSD